MRPIFNIVVVCLASAVWLSDGIAVAKTAQTSIDLNIETYDAFETQLDHNPRLAHLAFSSADGNANLWIVRRRGDWITFYVDANQPDGRDGAYEAKTAPTVRMHGNTGVYIDGSCPWSWCSSGVAEPLAKRALDMAP